MRAPLLSRVLIGLIGLGWLGTASFTARAQTTAGLYADFNTSLGNFTITLDFTNAPKTVANFIGLATGQRAWMDWNTGQVRTNPFYNGLLFHRVVSNFVIQAGSPNGQGTDGPGYVLMDEFSPNLRHNRTGVVAMAKSSSYLNNNTVLPHSGSSQFYITATTNSSISTLDGKYPIFGQVSSNLAVVLAINRVRTDTSTYKPLTNVVINSVTIRRVGTAAQSFNIQTQPLPAVQHIPTAITRTGQEVTLRFSNNFAYADSRYFDSSSLTQWTYNELGLDIAPPLQSNVVHTATNQTGFYNVSRVQYPSSTFAPRKPYNQKITLMYTYNDTMRETNRISFGRSGGGIYNSVPGGGSGTVTYYDWFQDIYRGYIWPLYFSGGVFPMVVELNYTSESGGNFAGVVYFVYPSVAWYDIAGTFTVSPCCVPDPPTLVSPLGGTNANPTINYTWEADACATWYELNVTKNGSTFVDKWVGPNDLASTNAGGKVWLSYAVKNHTSGTYSWWVRGWSSDGTGPWSGSNITVNLQLPGKVTLTSPTDAQTVTNLQPQCTWTAANPPASWYYLVINRSSTNYLSQWMELNSLVLSNGLPAGAYTWAVRSWNAAGYGLWSSTRSFTVPSHPPGVITLVSPTGSTTAGAKDYVWVPDPNTLWYELTVTKNGSSFLDNWYSKDALSIPSPGRVAAHVTTTHGNGSYQWWVRGWGPHGMGPWSAAMSFSVP